MPVAFLTRRTVPRRRFLRGLGAAVALPLLDAMTPARASALQRAALAKRRLGFVYIPHGVIMSQWTPALTGTAFELTPILQPLEPFRDSLVVVSNLTRAEVASNHAVSAACWSSAMRPRTGISPRKRYANARNISVSPSMPHTA